MTNVSHAKRRCKGDGCGYTGPINTFPISRRLKDGRVSYRHYCKKCRAESKRKREAEKKASMKIKPRDNKSGSAQRTSNRSHGQHSDIRAIIWGELLDYRGEFWQMKYNLAGSLSVKYGVPIGEVNHMIEQEARKMGARS